jgi:hypothetical protein
MRRVGWSAIVVLLSLGVVGCLQILGEFSIDSGDDDASTGDATLETGTSSESGIDAGGGNDATVEGGAGGGDGASASETGADAEVDGDAQAVADGQADAALEADADAEVDAEADAGPDADANAVVCDSGTHLPNACGGCSTLAHDAGSACTLSDGGCPGTYVCVAGDADAVTCDAPAKNKCGGCTTLAHDAGSVCSTKCDSGTWVCQDKTDDLTCNAPMVDLCGGCSIASGGSTACVTPPSVCDPTQGSCDTSGHCAYTSVECDGG